MDTFEDRIRGVEFVLPCDDLASNIAFFEQRLGFRLHSTFPADEPTVAVLRAHGATIRLDTNATGAPAALNVLCDPAPNATPDIGGTELIAPNGTMIRLISNNPPLALPPLRPTFTLCRGVDAEVWTTGRAGMQYRDLSPGRQGGRVVASHIRIPQGGPVPDYPHWHRVRFQMIYCYRGSVEVVYEDQGPAFELQAGDCVMQPPGIRHRVLRCSAGLEVIEVTAPAEHSTYANHEFELPNSTLDPTRRFDGQRFLRHRAAQAEQAPWRVSGFRARDLGIRAASDSVGSACVVTAQSGFAPVSESHEHELRFWFVTEGTLDLSVDGETPTRLRSGDAVVIPPHRDYVLSDRSEDAELLELDVLSLT